MSKLGLIILIAFASLIGGVLIFFGLIYFMFANANTEGFRGRFLITATVEVDGKLKSAQSVYEVSYNNVRNASIGGGGIYMGARGTMPYIDMGKYGTVVLNFYDTTGVYVENSNTRRKKDRCRESSVGGLPVWVMVPEDVKLSTGRAYVKAMMKAKGRFLLGNRTVPTYIIPAGKTIFEGHSVYFCDLSLVLGDNIRPVSISIEHTKEKLDFKIQNPPEWLIKWRKADKNSELKYPNWAGTKIYSAPKTTSIEREEFYR